MDKRHFVTYAHSEPKTKIISCFGPFWHLLFWRLWRTKSGQKWAKPQVKNACPMDIYALSQTTLNNQKSIWKWTWWSKLFIAYCETEIKAFKLYVNVLIGVVLHSKNWYNLSKHEKPCTRMIAIQQCLNKVYVKLLEPCVRINLNLWKYFGRWLCYWWWILSVYVTPFDFVWMATLYLWFSIVKSKEEIITAYDQNQNKLG